jgi:rod shape-determining protein MreD
LNASYRLLGPTERVRWWRAQVERVVPAVVTLVLVAAMTAPVFASAPVLPHLGLLGVFVWATFQPGLMPPWLAFVIGAVADILFGLPLGVNATLLPAVALFVRLVEAKFGTHRYGFDWLLAIGVILAFELLQWWLLALAGTHGPLTPLLVQAGTTILAYPAVVLLFASIQRRLQAAR